MAADDVLVEEKDAARWTRLAHLGGRVLQIDDLRSLFDDHGLGNRERLPETRIEALSKIAGQFQVLPLIFTHGNRIRLVDQDVGRLQDRVGEQSHRGAV